MLVRVVRMGKRSGLIRARLKGAATSTGQVITFLDAHCECTKGWLEPLLYEIAKDRLVVFIRELVSIFVIFCLG